MHKITGCCLAVAYLAMAMLLMACTPTIKLEAPDRPIVINLNVKVQQQVNVKVERDVRDLFQENKDIF